MVWTTTPSGRAMTISFFSPRLRSKAISAPDGDQTGFESLRPDSTGMSGRTYSGSIAACFSTGGAFLAGSSSATDSAARPSVAMTAVASSARPRHRQALASLRRFILDLSRVLPRRVAIPLEDGIPFEVFREEVEVLSPREVRVLHEGVFSGDQIELVIRQRQIEVGVVQSLVVVRGRKEARVLLGDLKILDRPRERLRGGVPVFFYEAVPLLVIRVSEIGEGHRELFVNELLVLGQ